MQTGAWNFEKSCCPAWKKPINQTDSLLYTHLRKEMEKKEYKCMSKAILVAIVSLLLGILAEASVGVS